jgi:hypothetical protein
MEKPMTEDLSQMETWEATTDGAVYVQVKDPRERTGWRQAKVTGRGRKKIQLSVEERLFNQDLVPDEKRSQHDPFSNGLLVRTSPASTEAPLDGAHYTDEQLVELLGLDSDEVFLASVEAIQSEVVVRRLLKLAETKATMVRYQALQELVDTRYHIGKTSRVVAEIYNDDAQYAHADL